MNYLKVNKVIQLHVPTYIIKSAPKTKNTSTASAFFYQGLINYQPEVRG